MVLTSSAEMDNQTILDDDLLHRRLEAEDFKENFTLENLKSSAFSDPFGEPSVHLERLANFDAINSRYQDTIFYAVFLTKDIRQQGFDAKHRPCEDDPSHCVILSSQLDLRKQSARKRLKKLVSRLVPVRSP